MMHSQSQVALEVHIPLTESSLLDNGDYNFHPSPSVAISTQNPGQKRTRQWAAWTRQEQENFFNALRQVGKNFEKITCRVQSKNKNQVRHYYYRLVRRMNKLLSPGFCLDAKNSKDTNAAMLRWWSLLEKYSCTPSKLHLKPRRFKIFIEALESQLRKDRNKTRRKRPCQENYLDTSSTSSFIRRFSGHDFCGEKPVAADAENTQKSGIIRGPSMKRNSNANVNFNKGIFSHIKATGQKQRIGLVESAALRRWEKAAMAGVSLVADAAEQLERVTSRDNCSFAHDVHRFSGICSHRVGDTVIQTREKLKLQLFPFDEDTRQKLEKGAHNPFLELTLSARKRISSVLEHLNRKWDIKDICSGELFLLPYNNQQDELAICQRWTIRDADSTAADVHASIGNPTVFRLRYGWFSGAEPRPIISNTCLAPGSDEDSFARFVNFNKSETNPPICSSSKLLGGSCSGPPFTSITSTAEACVQTDGLPESKKMGMSTNLQDDLVDPAIQSGPDLLAGEWADSLTNISVGDLLLDGPEVSSHQNALCIQHTSVSCDSFDAAVAAHNNYYPQFACQPNSSSVVSIWNDEDTCDEFSFKKAAALRAKSSNTVTDHVQDVSKDNTLNLHSSGLTHCNVGESGCDERESDSCLALCFKQEPAKDVSLSDLYWSDSLGSLGQLDLDLSFSRFQSHDLCFSESVSQGSFTRMIAGSLEVFQNGSVLGTDTKDTPGPLGEAAAVQDDNKMRSEN